MTRRPLLSVLYHPISLAGAVIALVNTGLFVFLTALVMLTKHPPAYADIIIFFLLPLLIFCGLVLILVGVVLERRRQRAGRIERRLPVLDFNDPTHRGIVFRLSAGFLAVIMLYAFAGYKAYEFSESDTFCGLACHTVMAPEYTAHRFSLHAEVGCAQCHVGPGAKYFVEAKLSGVRQLLGVMINQYPRPVPVPIHNLRPAQDTCEGCHGPKYALRGRLDSKTFYLSDAGNTEWTIDVLLKMGSARIETDRPPQMHWHSSTTEEILYATKDPKRMDIPWIQVKRRDGKVRVYRAADTAASDAELSQAPRRVMDCIDCHNRAGHYYRPPAESVNVLLKRKLIDPSLAEIKGLAVKVLDAPYDSREAARAAIRRVIEEFYREKDPSAPAPMKAKIQQAVVEIQRIYDRNYDPHMRVNWKNFPDQSGHMYTRGCFRCHDGKHVSADGSVLSKDCSLCHTLIAHEIAGDRKTATLKVLDYPHPVQIGDAYKEMNCSDCHGPR